MTTVYGTLEWFHEQGMEGNAQPIINDGSKRVMNRFGKVVGGYDAIAQLPDGCHLTIFDSQWVHDADLERMETGWTYPRYFDGVFQRTATMVGDNPWKVRVIHDVTFGPEVQHLWSYRRALVKMPHIEEEVIEWVPDRPATVREGTVAFEEGNPVHSFYDSVEAYEADYVTSIRDMYRTAWPEKVNTPDEEILAKLHARYQFHLLPAYRTWRWLFEQAFCAKMVIDD